VALLRMNRGDAVWPLLRHSPDPRVRSELIHRLAPLGADAGAIVRRLDAEPDLSSRRALLLALGEFGPRDLPAAAREKLLPKLQLIYCEDADPGLHAAAEWLLRTWQQDAWIRHVNDEWAEDAGSRTQRENGIRSRLAKDGNRAPPQWYVNGQAQTYVVLPGPIEFRMGSPATEVGRLESEVTHTRRIGRTFAIAAKSVTIAEYRRLTKDVYEIGEKYTRYPDLPVVVVSWYMAAKYCNLLSQAEGISESQWCYETDAGGNVTKLKANYLALSGYRLPTEAEVEYATRAGATTSRYFGESDELLRHYAWYTKSSGDSLQRVGSKKPNDFGLFDAHGNCFTWCQDPLADYPRSGGGIAVEDRELPPDQLAISGTVSRALRGGAYHYQSASLRSASRNGYVPGSRHDSFGFRPARTITY
jgi:formylglycine-generating enzyme required for sulfatase activity